jgi:hypothetical protein
MSLAIERAGAVLIVACLLQSCGGGGGSGVGDGGGGGGNSGGNPLPPPPPPTASELLPLLANGAEFYAELSFLPAEDAYFAMFVLSLAAQMLVDNQLETLDFQCNESGAVSLSADDLNGNGSFNPGDAVVVTYTACNGSISGTYALDVSQAGIVAGVINSLAGDLAFDIAFLRSSSATLSGSGDIFFTADATSLNWLGTDFRVTFSDGVNDESLLDARIQKIFNQDDSYSFAFSGKVESDILGGHFFVDSDPQFQGIEGQWPTSGELTIVGRNNSEIRYRRGPQTDVLLYEVDANGDGIIDDLAANVDWDRISSGYVFGISDDSSVPLPSTGPDLVGRRIALAAPAKDLAVNTSRGHIYVTIPSQHEVLVFSAATLEVVRRINVQSRPSGLSLSADGTEIFVGLAAAGSIAVLNADTFAETRIFVAPALESSKVYKVVETSPGILYVSTGIPNAEGRIARVDRGTGVVTPVATNAFAEIELLADHVRGALYVADGFQAQAPTVRKLDPNTAGTPLVVSETQAATNQATRLSLDPTGSRLYLASGHVLDTSDFSRIGRISPGVPWASDNGTEIIVASGERNLHVHSATTLREIDSLETDCWRSPEGGADFRSAQRLMPSPVNGQWLMLGEQVLCVVDFLNPDVPPGTSEPGVLPEPLPVTIVTSRSVNWGNTIFDAEYDDARKRLYISLFSVQELITVDAESVQILSREPLGHTARGLDLSPDGSTLAIVFNDDGHIAFKDLESGEIETRDISALLGTPAGYDVAWLNDDILFVSADPPCCEEPFNAYLARVSRSDPNADRRSAGGASNLWRAELAISPDGSSLFLSRGQEIRKVDLAQPGEPIVRSYTLDSSDITSGDFFHPRISPDGGQIAYSNGKILRTSDHFQAGEIRFGKSIYSPDGTTLYGSAGSLIDRYDAVTFKAIDRLEPSGNCGAPWQLLSTADGTELINASQSRVCFYKLNEPVSTAVKARAHDSYVCGAACMMRNYRNKAAVDVRATPQRQHPVRTIE